MFPKPLTYAESLTIGPKNIVIQLINGTGKQQSSASEYNALKDFDEYLLGEALLDIGSRRLFMYCTNIPAAATAEEG